VSQELWSSSVALPKRSGRGAALLLCVCALLIIFPRQGGGGRWEERTQSRCENNSPSHPSPRLWTVDTMGVSVRRSVPVPNGLRAFLAHAAHASVIN